MIGIARYLGVAAVSLAAGLAVAQQPAPPAFAPSNLSPAGIRSLAANCAACHGTNGRPASGSTLAGLAGKPRNEMSNSLTQFKEGKKPATVMHQLAKGYSDEELEALADYFSKQPR
ncbi:MAG TPA: c-type cytochrome [Usitatibacteraceae bacterium]|nr:c-type cytochrome [Usitatibacteraceae bacterium]